MTECKTRILTRCMNSNKREFIILAYVICISSAILYTEYFISLYYTCYKLILAFYSTKYFMLVGSIY